MREASTPDITPQLASMKAHFAQKVYSQPPFKAPDHTAHVKSLSIHRRQEYVPPTVASCVTRPHFNTNLQKQPKSITLKLARKGQTNPRLSQFGTATKSMRVASLISTKT